MEPQTAFEENDLRDMVLSERRKCVSEREWRHRLRGYGYAIRDTDEGRIVTSILRGGALCHLSGQLPA